MRCFSASVRPSASSVSKAEPPPEMRQITVIGREPLGERQHTLGRPTPGHQARVGGLHHFNALRQALPVRGGRWS